MPAPTVERPRAWHRVAAAVTLVATGLVAVGALGGTDPSPAAALGQAASPGDGTTAATAGASCWGIKQQFPTSPDGTYWLANAALVAPQQFWCDMTTDGGGWVLIGRGREGWSFRPGGQGSAAAIATTPSGTGAFAVATLPTSTVDKLTMGQAMRDYPDGIRVRRAADPAGTSWQEIRMAISGQSTWSWAFAADEPLASLRIGTKSWTAAQGGQRGTRDNDLAGDNGAFRVFTWQWNARVGWLAGFSYGSTVVGGSGAATNYFWVSANNEGHPIPFAQVFIRPRIGNDHAGFTAIPDAGTAATTVRPLLRSQTEWLNEWGVVGRDDRNDPVPDLDAQVLAFAQRGDRIFVGGKFSGVQKGRTGTPAPQPFLAAFDRTTGTWIDSFRPTLDGSVWEMVTDPQGRLLVAGAFTTVNGQPAPGMVALDPTTGAVDPSFRAQFQRRDGDLSANVRALSLQGGWLYVGGSFAGVSGGVGGATRTISQVNLARLDWRTGEPDWQWKASALGPVYDVNASSRDDRVYLAGLFLTVDNVTDATTLGTAVVDTTTGALVPGLAPIVPSYDCRPNCGNNYHPYGQAILESADGTGVFAAPTEHNLQLLDRATLARRSSHITRAGGDFQALAEIDGVVYGSCHCGDFDYSGPAQWSFPFGAFDRADHIRYLGGYRAGTLAKDNEFDPQMTSLYGEGPWDLFVDSDKCLWVGGDMTSGSWYNGSNMWAGGFVKYCPRDTTAPTTPPGFTASWPAGGSPTLSWKGATDDSGSVQYEVLRDDRVIATTWGWSYTDTGRTTAARYAVRAVDAAGNRSASTAMTRLQPAPTTVTLLSAGSTWSYDATGTDRGTAWCQPGFDVSSWPTGKGILGWNEPDLATTFTTTPITSYFVRTVDVGDPTRLASVTLDLIRDDGVVVYVNGTEVARFDVPTNQDYRTLAPVFVWGADERTWFSYPIPTSVLKPGANTIAVELHQATTHLGDASFDARLVATTR